MKVATITKFITSWYFTIVVPMSANLCFSHEDDENHKSPDWITHGTSISQFSATTMSFSCMQMVSSDAHSCPSRASSHSQFTLSMVGSILHFKVFLRGYLSITQDKHAADLEHTQFFFFSPFFNFVHHCHSGGEHEFRWCIRMCMYGLDLPKFVQHVFSRVFGPF